MWLASRNLATTELIYAYTYIQWIIHNVLQILYSNDRAVAIHFTYTLDHGEFASKTERPSEL